MENISTRIICNVNPGAGACILLRTPLVVIFLAQNITVQNFTNLQIIDAAWLHI